MNDMFDGIIVIGIMSFAILLVMGVVYITGYILMWLEEIYYFFKEKFARYKNNC